MLMAGRLAGRPLPAIRRVYLCAEDSIRRQVNLSEWAVARAPPPTRWLARGRRRLHRYLFRLADQESMRNSQHESLLSVEVRQGDHTTSPLQEPERLPIPATFPLQDIPEAAA